MYERKDTIAAICTPPGEGGVAIIRISGPQSVEVADRIFSGDVKNFSTHTVHYGQIAGIDSGLVVPMLPGYTGEETVEIHCHGGSIVSRRVLEAVLEAGARVAMPGEFTFRAFFNGKIDLAQAEAVQDVIGAKSGLALQAASDQLKGKLSKQVGQFQKELVDIAAVLEAWVDFPEEGLEFATLEELCEQLSGVVEKMRELIGSYEEGRRLREGVTVCLVGAPNVGKSSLMNVLCDRERSIVTPVAGTTRDLLEEEVTLGGFPVRLIDTAGIRETDEVVEREGIARSHQAIKEADLVLHIKDATGEDDVVVPGAIVVTNKVDLVPGIEGVSAKTGEGIDRLKKMLEEHLLGTKDRCEVILTNSRHKEALGLAIGACERTIRGLQEGISPEFICLDLREALHSLGTVVGLDVSEEVLTAVFAKFCLGK